MMAKNYDQKKLAVLVSGSGTLLDAIVESGIKVTLVVADRPCLGLEKAKNYGIKPVLVERTVWPKSEFDPIRDDFTTQFVAILQDDDIDLVCMAGWMTLFTQSMFDSFGGRVTNNHPALLPSFKGAHAVRDALAYGVKVTGCTIHYATVAEDVGPILAQEAITVLDDDTEEALQERIKQVERRLLPQVLKRLLTA